MIKIKQFLIVFVIFLSAINHVNAASSCSYEQQVEFNNLASNVKVSYEAVDIYDGKAINIDGDGKEVDVYIRGLNINILNITEGIYIKVIDKKDDSSRVYHYSDSVDGVVTFQIKDVDEVGNYTIEVYADKYSCINELYRSIPFTTPRYNNYSEMAVCQENPGFYYCQEFINSDAIDINSFHSYLNNYRTEEDKRREEEKKSIWDKIKDYLYKCFLIINKN